MTIRKMAANTQNQSEQRKPGCEIDIWRNKMGKCKNIRNMCNETHKIESEPGSPFVFSAVIMKVIALRSFLLVAVSQGARATQYFNPILPGFHPDPSCIYVEELDQTFFCATSSFSIFPGVPIYASKDLTNWKLASNVLNRPSQLPDFASTPTGQDGIFAPTLRYHDETFYLITTWVSIASYQDFKMDNIIFTSSDPFNSSSWSNPTHFDFIGYDPSLFWDVDGTAYLTGAQATSTGTAIALAPFKPSTGEYLGPTIYP